MLMPARVEPTLTLEQTLSVTESACGMLSIRRRSLSLAPFWTSAVKPPTKLTPTSLEALSSAMAMGVRSSALVAPQISAMGVTAMRLWMIGIPYSGTSFSAAMVRRS